MAELPRIGKDADDLLRPRRRLSWRAMLSSAVAAVGVSFGFGAATPSSAPAAQQPALTATEITSPARSAKPVLKSVKQILRLAQEHWSHESHESHASHESHESHYSGG